jgi:hypothetical protein
MLAREERVLPCVKAGHFVSNKFWLQDRSLPKQFRCFRRCMCWIRMVLRQVFEGLYHYSWRGRPLRGRCCAVRGLEVLYYVWVELDIVYATPGSKLTFTARAYQDLRTQIA